VLEQDQQPDGSYLPRAAHTMARTRLGPAKIGTIAADPRRLDHQPRLGGTLVERSTQFVMLPHLSNRYSPATRWPTRSTPCRPSYGSL
jgi:hypothetical protein